MKLHIKCTKSPVVFRSPDAPVTLIYGGDIVELNGVTWEGGTILVEGAHDLTLEDIAWEECAVDTSPEVSLHIATYEVVGSSGRTYHVSSYTDGTYVCTCPDFEFRQRHCKHIKQMFSL